MRVSTSTSLATFASLLLATAPAVVDASLSRRCIAKCEDLALPSFPHQNQNLAGLPPPTRAPCIDVLLPRDLDTNLFDDDPDVDVAPLCIHLSKKSDAGTGSSSAGRTATSTTATGGDKNWGQGHNWNASGSPTSTVGATATGQPSPSLSASSNAHSHSAPNGTAYTVMDRFEGKSFFSGFTFDNISDPTHGNVNYVSQQQAMQDGLTYVDGGVAVIKVDNTTTIPSGRNRNSVRITSKNAYTSGLIVLDVENTPYGCGVWPAFWTVGDNWPYGGEIDIVEGVNTQTNAEYTLHTAPGCDIDPAYAISSSSKGRRGHRGWSSRSAHKGGRATSGSAEAMAFTGRILKTTCDATTDGNSGCGVQDPDDSSFGQGLNDNGGGVFATLLDSDGVGIWFFPRDSIPDDIASGSPQPSSWPSPKAFWSSSTCPTKQFFGPQRIVINTTLCGDWAGTAFSSAGCGNSCADYVADPSNFDTAAWRIRSVTVYNVPDAATSN